VGDIPQPVREYIHEHVTEQLFAAFMGVDGDGLLVTWGGPLSRYGIEKPSAGCPVVDLAPFLEGTLPLRGEPLLLPQIQTVQATYADIHLFPGKGFDWVVLLDRTRESLSQQLMQQRRNELALLRDLHSRILDQFLGKKVASDLAGGLLKLKEEGERRVITVLFADVRGSTAFSERHPPEVVFRTLSLYLRAMLGPILLEAGLVDKLIGDGVMAIFGLVPSTSPAPTLAVHAATHMLEEVDRVNQERAVGGLEELEIGIGIATGPAVLGILGTKERRAFSAIGHHVNLAARLEGRAGPREIAIDSSTHDGLVDVNLGFSARALRLKGIEDEVTAYFYRKNPRLEP
jgi:class 3 adenylate cyclase